MQDLFGDIVLIIHVILAICMIGAVLLQRSEGGGLGIGGGGGGGGGGGMSGFMTGRGTANLLTRTTAILAACFMATSILLSIYAGRSTEPRSILDDLPIAVPSGETTGSGDSSPSVPVQ